MDKCFQILNNKLISCLDKNKYPLGLAYGKMGLCIYFYHLDSYKQNLEYRIYAKKLLGDVFNQINNVIELDIKNGLAGIGLGINHVIENKFLEGKVNSILSDIDDRIFKTYNSPITDSNEDYDFSCVLEIIYYLCIRLERQKKNSESEYLFKELIIILLNDLYSKITPAFFEEPLYYNIDYVSPKLLFILSKIYYLGFYNYRIKKMLDELSPYIRFTFPTLHSNRIYLLWGMLLVNKYYPDLSWRRHIDLLRKEIDFNHLLTKELRNKNIYFYDGLTSTWRFLHDLKEILPFERNHYAELIMHKIKKSDIWELLLKDDNYFVSKSGLMNGYTGIILALTQLKK